MLTSIRLQNYRCFRDVTVSLRPLTAIVGPNATGKTALLRALTRSEFLERDLRAGTSGDGSVTWMDGLAQVECRVLGRQPNRLEQQYLHLDLRAMREHRQIHEARRIDERGANLVNVLATLSRREQERISREFTRLVPVLRDIDHRPTNANGVHRLVFQDRWQPQVWHEPTEVSDGTLLALALLILPYQPDAPDLVAIEEPERSLHPYLIAEIVRLLRRLAAGELGRKAVQVVLATQSPQVLDQLEPEEVRFLDRDPSDGSVIVTEAPTDRADWRAIYDEYQRSLGSLWLSGGLGGVPGGAGA